MRNEDKNQKLEELLIKISKDNSLKNVSGYIGEFKEIYSENFRHEYSTITRVLMSINDSEERDFLTEKIKIINKNINEVRIKEKVEKLWDHINLENIRMVELYTIAQSISEKAHNEVKDIEKNISLAEVNLKSVDRKYENAEKLLMELQESFKNSTSQSITILSIFAGVVMAFTGGMSYISQALASLNQIGPYRAGIFIVLIGTVMFNLIFLLLYMIGKLTDKYIGSICQCDNPRNGCSNKSLRCSIKRYPYIIWFNLISFIIIGTILIIYSIDRYNILTKVFIDNSDKLIWYKLSLVSIVIPYIIVGIIIYFILKVECNTSEQ